MGNNTVRGRIVDNNDAPKPGLTVEVYDNDIWPFRDFLGSSVTNGNGDFVVTYLENKYGPMEKQPDIVVEIFQGGSMIFKTKENPDVKVQDLDIGTVKITGHNFGLKGRVIDQNGKGISDLVVVAHDIDIGSKNDLLGRTTTDENGAYDITYSPRVYFAVNDQNPDIVVTVLDRPGIRELTKTSEFGDVTSAILSIPDITIQRSDAEGWVTTLGGSSPSLLTQNNDVEVLIDGFKTFDEIIKAVKRAQSRINLLQLFWEPDFIATFTGDTPPTNATKPNDILAEVLLAANRRGVEVRILLNENAITPDTFDEISDFFKGKGSNTVSVRRFPLTIQTMHAKSLIVDGKEAFIIGSPFEQGYWDTPIHLLVDSRRGPLLGIGSRPLHDVSVHIKGPSVTDIDENFAMLWNFRSDDEFAGADKIASLSRPPAAGTQAVQIVKSLPRGILPNVPNGELGILEAYQRAFANASDFIYLENQYFSGRAIVQALIRVLNTNPNLKVILLINENPDIPTYREWQNHRLLKQIGFPHPRVGVFTLWNTGFAAGKFSIQRCYLHSKVAIVDDKWATIGTANLDGISLEQGTEFTFAGTGPGRSKRHVEINSVLYDGISNQAATGNVSKIRHSLWSEHLGRSIPNNPPAGDWLTFWTSVANANIASLNASSPSMSGHILPYSIKAKEKDQLTSLGINTSGLNILN